MERRVRYLLLVPMIVAVAAPALADNKDAASTPISRLTACRSIQDDKARLACFDREVVPIATSVQNGDLKVIDREEAKSVRRSLFGFALPPLPFFGGSGTKDAAEEDIKVLDTTITSLKALPQGRWAFTVAEGSAHWETMEAPTRLIDPRVGQKVQLQRAALGSYWVRFNGQLGVKGRRVN